MYTHKLTINDSWFIEKNQVDVMTRSPFSVGDEVVVCDNRHVMLARYYDGKCPTCQSVITVPFLKKNVEIKHIKIKFEKEPLSKLFPSKVLKKIVPRIQISLLCIIGILSLAIFALILWNVIPFDSVLSKCINTIEPKVFLHYNNICTFWDNLVTRLSIHIRTGSLQQLRNDFFVLIEIFKRGGERLLVLVENKAAEFYVWISGL